MGRASDAPADACTLERPLFFSRKAPEETEDFYRLSVCRFNSDTMTFEVIMPNEIGAGSFVQKFGDYLVLQSDRKTTVYNELTSAYQSFDSANSSVEGDYIYLMMFEGDFGHQTGRPVFTGGQKILLRDIK